MNSNAIRFGRLAEMILHLTITAFLETNNLFVCQELLNTSSKGALRYAGFLTNDLDILGSKVLGQAAEEIILLLSDVRCQLCRDELVFIRQEQGHQRGVAEEFLGQENQRLEVLV